MQLVLLLWCKKTGKHDVEDLWELVRFNLMIRALMAIQSHFLQYISTTVKTIYNLANPMNGKHQVAILLNVSSENSKCILNTAAILCCYMLIYIQCMIWIAHRTMSFRTQLDEPFSCFSWPVCYVSFERIWPSWHMLTTAIIEGPFRPGFPSTKNTRIVLIVN